MNLEFGVNSSIRLKSIFTEKYKFSRDKRPNYFERNYRNLINHHLCCSISKHPYNRISTSCIEHRLISRVSPVSIFNFRRVPNRCKPLAHVSRFNTALHIPRARFTSNARRTHPVDPSPRLVLPNFNSFIHTTCATIRWILAMFFLPTILFRRQFCVRAYFEIRYAYVLFSPLTRSSSLPLFLLGRASRGKLNEKGKKRYDDQDVRTRSTPLDASSTFFHAKKSTGGGGSVWLRNSQQESSTGEVCGPIKNIPGFFVSTAAPLMGSTHQGTRTRVSRYIHSQLERGNLN